MPVRALVTPGDTSASAWRLIHRTKHTAHRRPTGRSGAAAGNGEQAGEQRLKAAIAQGQKVLELDSGALRSTPRQAPQARGDEGTEARLERGDIRRAAEAVGEDVEATGLGE